MNAGNIPSKASLFFRDGTSDKVYAAEVVGADSGFLVNTAWGRRGSTLQTSCKTPKPVPLEQAVRIFEKLIAEKMAKGYTPSETGLAYANSDKVGDVSGWLPQLLNPIDEQRLEELLRDESHYAQEKVDGRRLILIRDSSAPSVLQVVNRKGLFVGFPEAWQKLEATNVADDFVLDGEGIGEQFYAFDLLQLNGRDLRPLPFRQRYELLAELVGEDLTDEIRLVPATNSEQEKRSLLQMVRATHREGVVFKRADAPYRAGRPNSGGDQLKFKLVESGTFLVLQPNAGKRSVAVGAFDADGQIVALGNVTVPPNQPVPAKGDLVDVRYLYRHGTGSLVQPQFERIRDDLDPSAAVLTQIRRIKVQDDDTEDA